MVTALSMKRTKPTPAANRRRASLPPLPTAGDILREDFMKPLGLTAAQIGNAIPPQMHPRGPHLGDGFWAYRIRKLIGDEPDDFDW